jgi:hypothetical protein
MQTIRDGDRKIAVIIRGGDIGEGLTFCSDDKDFIQVGSWNYNSGKELLAHSHNRVERSIDRTQECIIVLSGSVRARIYSDNRRLLATEELHPHDTLIAFSGGHGYDILEDGTRVIEVKNGPYMGAALDRTRFESEVEGV